MQEFGLFSDDSADFTAEEAVEAQFYSREEAEAALLDRYPGELGEGLFVQEVEEGEDEENEDEENEDD